MSGGENPIFIDQWAAACKLVIFDFESIKENICESRLNIEGYREKLKKQIDQSEEKKFELNDVSFQAPIFSRKEQALGGHSDAVSRHRTKVRRVRVTRGRSFRTYSCTRSLVKYVH